MKIFFLSLIAGLLFVVPVLAADEDSAAKLPRFATLAKDEIFVRTGPALQYPIRWVYRKSGLPVEIVREYDTWRQVKDIDGSVGWVHHAMLSSYRNAIVSGKDGVTITAEPDATANAVVRLEKGVIVSIETCEKAWCHVRISGFKGYAPRAALWGIYPSEEIR